MKPSFKSLCIFTLFLFSFSAFADNAREGMRLFEAGKYQQAMTYFMKEDAQKNPDILNHIAYMYDKGIGLEKNKQIAFQWYEKAAEMGYAKSQFNLGLCYLNGDGVSKDIKEAIKWFRLAAEQQDADAEAQLGYLTATGKGIKQNFLEALSWYRLAAEHGDIAAYANIGHFYSDGHGVKKNKNRAVQYYIIGAEKGDPVARFYLGHAYHYGRGIKDDPERALYWYRRAAEQGNADALQALGGIYVHGLLNQKEDRAKGEKYIEEAIRIRKQTGQRDPAAMRRLRLLGIGPDQACLMVFHLPEC